MSVLSKALRYIVAVTLFIGCVAVQSGMADESESNAALSGETAPGSLTLESLTLNQTSEATGLVAIALSGESAFELRQTAATEYCVIIPGATAAQAARIPQVAPPGTSGIRSARAVQEDNTVMVRMFVDGGVTLKAEPNGNEILVKPVTDLKVPSSGSRAQMAEEEEDDEDYEDEAGQDEMALEETARQNPTGIQSADGSKTYTGRLISLDLQDTDIDNALRIIAEVSNLNIIASDDVTGKVTLRLIDVPWDQALDVILKTNGLDQVTEGNVIRIAPVDKLRQEREALLEAKRAAQNLEDLKVSYIRVSYAQVGDMQTQVESVLSERGTVTVDERTNQLIVKDIGEGQARSAELIQRLDLRTPQVLLETQIVEGDRSILRDLGFQWNFEYNRGPATGNATGVNFPNSVAATGASDFLGANNGLIGAVLDSADGSRLLNFNLSALETEGKAKIISRPQVATINNRQAEIKSVEVLRIKLPDSGLSVATGSGASASGGASAAFEEIDVGIVLTVTPQASPDYYVLLDVNAKSSTLGSREVDGIPSTIEREATSAVLVKSGTTFALGGVYRIEDRDSVEGLPFLKDIPFLGYMFRNQTADKSDEELIFFITPHIVEGSFDPGAMKAAVKG
jgi:type IV pilus assembly protein PilQ